MNFGNRALSGRKAMLRKTWEDAMDAIKNSKSSSIITPDYIKDQT